MTPAIKQGMWFLVVGALLLSVPGVPVANAEDASPQCVGIFKTASALPAMRVVPQGHHDARTNALFSFSATRDGGVRMVVKAGDLQVNKVAYVGGRLAIEVQAGNDRVFVALGSAGLDVERGKRRIHFDGQGSEDDLLQVRTLLAGSRAIRLLRTLSLGVEAETLQHPAGASLVLSDALLGYLDGDVAAVARLGQQFRSAHQARIRPVGLGLLRNKCWDQYEADVVEAADEYDACRHMFSWYDPRQAGCALVWTIQAESAWFVFLSCSAVPLREE